MFLGRLVLDVEQDCQVGVGRLDEREFSLDGLTQAVGNGIERPTHLAGRTRHLEPERGEKAVEVQPVPSLDFRLLHPTLPEVAKDGVRKGRAHALAPVLGNHARAGHEPFPRPFLLRVSVR